ncbi:MAG: phenylacetate--CoA ligase family protein [Planctomycetota bacterium]
MQTTIEGFGVSYAMSMYPWICSNVLLPFSDLILGQKVSERLNQLRGFQWKSTDEIDRYRDRRVAELLSKASGCVPYYAEVFKQRNLNRDSIRTVGDLCKLPILDKKTIREQSDNLLDSSYRGKKIKMMSSGSTGTQTTVWTDPSCMDEVFATQLLFWEWGGFQLGKAHLQTGMSIRRGVLKGVKDFVFRCSYVSAFGLRDQELKTMVERIDRYKINAIFGYASSIYVLAKFMESSGQTRSMKSIFTWGDSLFPHYRELIERVFQCKVNDCYGLGEGLQCAAQCELHQGLHEAMHGVVVEILDSDGQPLPIGELGRVVVTRLDHGCMPLIRYDTGDVASFLPERCSCGRNLKLISRIQGRATDIVSTPSGDRLIVHFFTQLFEMIPQIVHFQVRQEQSDRIKILYVPAVDFTPDLLVKLKTQILENCTYPLESDFVPVAEIPLEKSNKRRFVISNVPI